MNEPNQAPRNEREQRVYEWIRDLTEFPERFGGSANERLAAEKIGGWLDGLGFPGAVVSGAPGGPRPGYSLAVHTGISLLGLWWGGAFGLLLTWLAVYSFRREQVTRHHLLSRLLPIPDSVNVVARRGPDRPQRRVVLSAHIDTTEAGWMFSRAVAERFAKTNQTAKRTDGQPQSPFAIPYMLLILAVILTAASWLGASGFILGVGSKAVGIGLLVTTILTIQWSLSPATPGANDNASAVAAMLICAESLRDRLPEDTELVVAGTGSEECGHGGMIRVVEDYGAVNPEQTYYVNFECVGGGHLHYIVTEGLLNRVTYPPLMNEVARRVAATGEFGEVTPTHLLAGTDGCVPAQLGRPALSLITLEDNGVPRNYHRPEDTVDGIDCSAVVRSADFGTAVTLAVLAGAADPVRA